MKTLTLDDDRSRQAKFFLAKKQGEELRQVWNAADCIEALKEGGWSIVQLDHDLLGEPYQDPLDENCGSAVVRWIVENKPDVEEFIVHSYNHFTAPEMVEDLKKAGYEAIWTPFSL